MFNTFCLPGYKELFSKIFKLKAKFRISEDIQLTESQLYISDVFGDPKRSISDGQLEDVVVDKTKAFQALIEYIAHNQTYFSVLEITIEKSESEKNQIDYDNKRNSYTIKLANKTIQQFLQAFRELQYTQANSSNGHDGNSPTRHSHNVTIFGKENKDMTQAIDDDEYFYEKQESQIRHHTEISEKLPSEYKHSKPPLKNPSRKSSGLESTILFDILSRLRRQELLRLTTSRRFYFLSLPSLVRGLAHILLEEYEKAKSCLPSYLKVILGLFQLEGYEHLFNIKENINELDKAAESLISLNSSENISQFNTNENFIKDKNNLETLLLTFFIFYYFRNNLMEKINTDITYSDEQQNSDMGISGGNITTIDIGHAQSNPQIERNENTALRCLNVTVPDNDMFSHALEIHSNSINNLENKSVSSDIVTNQNILDGILEKESIPSPRHQNNNNLNGDIKNTLNGSKQNQNDLSKCLKVEDNYNNSENDIYNTLNQFRKNGNSLFPDPSLNNHSHNNTTENETNLNFEQTTSEYTGETDKNLTKIKTEFEGTKSFGTSRKALSPTSTRLISDDYTHLLDYYLFFYHSHDRFSHNICYIFTIELIELMKIFSVDERKRKMLIWALERRLGRKIDVDQNISFKMNDSLENMMDNTVSSVKSEYSFTVSRTTSPCYKLILNKISLEITSNLNHFELYVNDKMAKCNKSTRTSVKKTELIHYVNCYDFYFLPEHEHYLLNLVIKQDDHIIHRQLLSLRAEKIDISPENPFTIDYEQIIHSFDKKDLNSKESVRKYDSKKLAVSNCQNEELDTENHLMSRQKKKDFFMKDVHYREKLNVEDLNIVDLEEKRPALKNIDSCKLDLKDSNGTHLDIKSHKFDLKDFNETHLDIENIDSCKLDLKDYNETHLDIKSNKLNLKDYNETHIDIKSCKLDLKDSNGTHLDIKSHKLDLKDFNETHLDMKNIDGHALKSEDSNADNLHTLKIYETGHPNSEVLKNLKLFDPNVCPNNDILEILFYQQYHNHLATKISYKSKPLSLLSKYYLKYGKLLLPICYGNEKMLYLIDYERKKKGYLEFRTRCGYEMYR